jgi:hypothetical protein
MTVRIAAPARVACGIGAVVVVVTTLVAGGFAVSLFLVGLLAWALAPYAAVWLLPRVTQNAWVQTGAALAVLAGELYVRVELLFFARGSTSSLVLLFSPLYLLVVALPVGAGLGWVIGRGWRRSRPAGRGLIVAAGVACAVLAGIAAARPAWLPYGLGTLVSAKERIGPARVVAGEAVLKKMRLSSRSAWYDVGAFDGTPQETIASIADRDVVLLDPATGAEKGRLAFSPEARRRWNGFSRLVRDGAELVIVQTGGGYSEVEVLEFGGAPRWRFRPDPALPPIALLPRGVDGAGRVAFYAASKDSVYRLDATGGVVWTRTTGGLVNALDVAAAEQGQPALVVAVGTGGRVWTWDADGRAQEQITLPGDDYRYKLVAWPRARSLVGGSKAVRAFDLEGRRLFEHALGDFRYGDAVAVRLESAGPPHLAVLAAAPREVGLARLLVFSAAGDLVYDEILPTYARVMTAADGAGRGQMLLLSDASGLVAYRK